MSTIPTGKFNSVYWAWLPGVKRVSGNGAEIELWVEEQNPTYLIVGESTRHVGNMLDLV